MRRLTIQEHETLKRTLPLPIHTCTISGALTLTQSNYNRDVILVFYNELGFLQRYLFKPGEKIPMKLRRALSDEGAR